MRSMLTPGRLFFVPALTLFIACASGTDDLQPGYEEQAGGVGGMGGASGAGEEESGVGGEDGTEHVASPSVGSTGVGGAASEGDGGDGGSEGGGGEGGDGGDGGAAAECDYGAPNTCMRAENLGEVPGDDGADPVTLTVTGTTSKWFKVRVVDKANFPTTIERFSATLTSPPGMNFDLIVYQGEIGGNAPDCFATGVRGQGEPESFSTTWDDRAFLDDDVWFVIEVRHVEGTACGSEAAWTLTVRGH